MDGMKEGADAGRDKSFFRVAAAELQSNQEGYLKWVIPAPCPGCVRYLASSPTSLRTGRCLGRGRGLKRVWGILDLTDEPENGDLGWREIMLSLLGC
jgi:hypothetical protein